MRLYRRCHRDRDCRIASSSQANGNCRNSERLAPCCRSGCGPRSFSILSVNRLQQQPRP
jgi:hypothetical protein